MGGLTAQDLTGIKIHINPGHGGWDSDDRGISTPLIPSVGPNVGFWESQSNLDKGLMLRDMLLELGATVQMSRTLNRTEDDLALSAIIRMANEFNADFMLSIHSNAGSGTANYVLMLFAGISDSDTQRVYPTPTPKSNESRDISTEIGKNLYKNTLTPWTASYNISGDKTFARMYMGWSDGYGVLRGLTVPGVISEGSMHDYIPETYRLMNMEYKWLESWNFKKAFLTYFKNAQIPTGNIAGTVKDSRNLILDGTYRKYQKDVLLPLDGAVVTVVETGETYTVDQMRNGVFVFKNLQPGVYNVKAEAAGYYPQTQEITVVKNEHNYLTFELNKIRDTPPVVTNYSPKVAAGETVVASTDIVLEFNWDMDEESTTTAFSITPHVDGKITFEDSQYRMRFTPDLPLEKSTLYTVKLDKSAKHPNNISMVEDFSFSFTTKDRNRLVLLDSYPRDGDKNVHADKPLFKLIFDNKLNSGNIRNEVQVLNAQGVEITKGTRSVQINKIDKPYGDISFELTEALVAGNKYKLLITGDAMDDDGVLVVDPVTINFTAADIKVTDKTIVENFDVASRFTYDAENSQNCSKAAFARNTSEKLFGTATYKLTATFTDADAHALYTYSLDNIATSEDNKVIGLHVFGDMSGNALQLQLQSTENPSEAEYLTIATLDFVGWEFREVAVPFAIPYRLTGVRLVRQESILSASTEIYVDNMLLYDKPISGFTNLKADFISLYPNPTKDIIHVNIDGHKQPTLQLYSLNGKLLKSITANQINISEFDNGTYLLKVITTEGSWGKAVIKL